MKSWLYNSITIPFSLIRMYIDVYPTTWNIGSTDFIKCSNRSHRSEANNTYVVAFFFWIMKAPYLFSNRGIKKLAIWFNSIADFLNQIYMNSFTIIRSHHKLRIYLKGITTTYRRNIWSDLSDTDSSDTDSSNARFQIKCGCI